MLASLHCGFACVWFGQVGQYLMPQWQQGNPGIGDERLFIGMNGQMLLRKTIGIHIELVVKVKAQVDQLDRDLKDKWGYEYLW